VGHAEVGQVHGAVYGALIVVSQIAIVVEKGQGALKGIGDLVS